MAVTKTALVLLQLTVTALAWENLPQIPANRRAEYYLQHDDGAYKYGYDTGEGQSAQANADATNQVVGKWQYINNEGQRVNWGYTAGVEGYVPLMADLEGGAQVKSHQSAQQVQRGQQSWSSGGATGAGQHQQASWSSGSGVQPKSADNAGTVINPDGSFSFSYTTGDQSRQESADAQNNVRGSYSFKAKDDGQTRRVNYHAGAATGFVATGDHLPVAPQVPAVKSWSDNTAQKSWSDNTAQKSWASAADAAENAGAKSGQQVDEQDNGDGSYSYNYKTDSSDKHETSDQQGNVKGSFSYVGPDGVNRKLSYTSNGDEGFIATGDHLPVAPAVPAVPAAASSWSSKSGSGSGSSWNSGASGSSGSSWNSGAAAAKAAPAWSGKAADITTNQKNDGSYSYSYSTGDQSVQQSSDANNNVKGSYSFKAIDDGQTRTVNWKAGADTGFVAQGAHLPVAPVAGAAPAPTSWSAKSGSGSGSGASWNSGASGSSWNSGSAGVKTAGVGSNSDSEDNGDGSYSYSYKTDSSDKHETSDQQGNVKGSFSYVGPDGVNRKLSYTSNGDEGFIATGDHLPVAPVAGAAPAPASWSAKSGSGSESGVSWNSGASGSSWNSGAAAAKAAPAWSGKAADITNNQKNDGSYSYSYSTDTQNVKQSSDANNNVQGSYSFKAIDDGQTRTVNWKAGADTGFVAQGAHLPVAPVAGAAPAPSSWSAKSGSGSGSAAGSSWNSGASGSSWNSGAGAAKAAPTWSGKAADSSIDQKNDGSYSYSYSTGDQSVQQSSDANNNVKGSYSFKAIDDGVERRVDYTAGAETGFVATGAHLPVAPVAGAAPAASSWSSKSGSGSGSGPSWNSGASGSSWNSGATAAKAAPAWSGKAADITNNQKNDGSYSYSYSTDTQNVKQSSDANNNVQGSYSFKAIDDGQTRTVNWKAGADTGFVAQGAHLPVAPVAGAAPAASSWSAKSGSGSESGSSWNSGAAGSSWNSGSAGVKSASSGSNSDSEDNGDGSYSYSYKTDSSSKDETADAQGNVVGSFSYVDGDGVSRKLSYTARGEEGFLASGAHLPVAPVVGQVAVARPYAPLPVVRSSSGGSHQASGATAQSSGHAHAHGQETKVGNVVITKYLPPDSHHKYGYVFDTKQ